MGLPDQSGLDVLRTLRGHKDRTPVLILMARYPVMDKVSGLDVGVNVPANVPVWYKKNDNYCRKMLPMLT